jgi:hypothetical protein
MTLVPKHRTPLEEIEGEAWSEPDYDSYLVRTCHQLRKKPLDQFTAEDFRILIGQNIGTLHLLPRVLPLLRETPLLEGDFYPGDVLSAICRLDPNELDPSIAQELIPVFERAISWLEASEQVDRELTQEWRGFHDRLPRPTHGSCHSLQS